MAKEVPTPVNDESTIIQGRMPLLIAPRLAPVLPMKVGAVVETKLAALPAPAPRLVARSSIVEPAATVPIDETLTARFCPVPAVRVITPAPAAGISCWRFSTEGPSAEPR